jgi:hypothetical protein
VRTGEPLDHGFENALHAQLQQLRLLANANGGMDALAVQPYLQRFEDGVRARFDEDGGSLMRSCFKAVETKGVCRHALWPYAAAAATPVWAGLPEYSEAVRRMCEKKGICFIDNDSLVQEHEDLYAGDGVHLQPDFYHYWGENQQLGVFDHKNGRRTFSFPEQDR